MRHPAGRTTRLADRAHRRRRHGLVAAVVAAGVLAGCGSSAEEPQSKTGDATFCSVIDDYVEAAKAGDRTEMADVLDETVEGLPAEASETVSAYVTALRASPANEDLEGDGVESDATDQAFRAYVADACGDDVDLPKDATTTTSTTSPPRPGGSSTDDTSVDGGSMDGGTDTGSGGGAGAS